ncbi:MAG TPA: hypothetical protein VGE50_05520 [Gammaproteobacteria bacterium]
MDGQDLLYALNQIAHNFGAVAVVGGALLGRWPVRVVLAQRRPLAWLVLAGWILQGVSGATFGAISFAYYGQFPDIHGIAVAALLVKMSCAFAGIILTALWLRFGDKWSERSREGVWGLLLLLAITALSAAAFLRWFS